MNSTTNQSYFYGGAGVSINHLVGLMAVGVVPNWSAPIRALKKRYADRLTEESTHPENLLVFDCLLSEVIATLELPPRETEETWVTLFIDAVGRETYIFIPDTFAVDQVGYSTLEKRLPLHNEILALSPLGQVGIFVGSTEENFEFPSERGLERRLERTEAAAKAVYQKVLAEVLTPRTAGLTS